ncbi:diacylglycerol/polyprenol kinase family protein [Synechococcus elongatus]|uniref:Phosphatidate cytidylyltransferase n=2 Tax=Synechococcus elongatus TaxID=32046 RepID=Q31PE6_SYNE7|nr:diacylglycerol/polyprenol kinase family protein [Synechococcus elongatus]MBD2688747.1 phosphatidate cytidylyltransferase [Synechococcus elongatus FACHB-1061]ABB57073.1 conserved hypothetical protein [Synechococcus elongatus PCC 7942 = FACHB-805]AJD58410.1 phosphatidate cytidylyltransferase [Synechococcus elongatus UTEX 2973]MBD2587474.1 phosphatidate cytidylyltransferase [Synechococcus elongatus FACHB-242]MBD2707818.1 phosphatidate cytidylyltransferase [Synechococcus elongatus PCC 7942 = FA
MSGILAVVAWLGLVGLLAWLASRHPDIPNEWVRKIVHIGTGNVILIAWAFQIPAAIGIAAAVLFSGVALLSFWLPILPGLQNVGRHSLGTFFYAVSIGLLIAGFWHWAPRYAALGILVMTYGDGLAALVGQQWGRHRFHLQGIGQKSWEGSLTMMAVSFLVAVILLGLTQTPGTIAISLAVAIAAPLLELWSWYGIDNLSVPLGCAIVAAGVSHLFS